MVVHENINVFGRVRPFSEWIGRKDNTCVSIDPATDSIVVHSTDKTRRFALNKVFCENTKQVIFFMSFVFLFYSFVSRKLYSLKLVIQSLMVLSVVSMAQSSLMVKLELGKLIL